MILPNQRLNKSPRNLIEIAEPILLSKIGVNSIETTVMNMETEPGDKEELQVSPESPLNPEDRAEATSEEVMMKLPRPRRVSLAIVLASRSS